MTKSKYMKVKENIKISGKHVHVIYTPYTPLSYSKTGVYRGIHILFLSKTL